MADSTIIVTPELLRSTQQAIVSALEHATAIANGYLAEQENINGVGTWAGQAVMSSTNTATQINHDLQQTIQGGHRLADGLAKAAVLIEAHEADSSQAFSTLCTTH